MRLRHKSIYQAVYRPGSTLLRPSPLAPRCRSRRAQDVTTGARISAETSAAPGSSSPAHDPSVALSAAPTRWSLLLLAWASTGVAQTSSEVAGASRSGGCVPEGSGNRTDGPGRVVG
jgi:hypothetical protein